MVIVTVGLQRGFTGFSSGACWPLPASVRFFRLLQRQHAVTMFSQVLRPPFAMGTTWSKVGSSVRNLCRQYWQQYPSR